MLFYGGVMSTFITDAVPPNVIQIVLITVLHGIARPGYSHLRLVRENNEPGGLL
jgi:hypothetical protein